MTAPLIPVSLVGRRIDWLSFAFRARLPSQRVDDLRERVAVAKKHGRAPADFAGELWELRAPKGPSWWFESEARRERLELLLSAPGQYVGGAGEVIPGFTLALHLSGNGWSGHLSVAVRRAWRIARRAGEVFEARVRRVDAAADFRGVLVSALDARTWHALPMVGSARMLEDGSTVKEDRHDRRRVPDRRNASGGSVVGSGAGGDVQCSLFASIGGDGVSVRPG